MTTERNVNDVERWTSVVLGSALAVYGMKKRTIGGMVLAGAGGALLWRGATGYCPLYGTLGITTAGATGDERHVSVPYGRGVGVEESVIVDAPPDRVYAFWRNFANLPRFMNNLERVDVHDDRRSRWVAKGPARSDVSWEAEIINEVPNELIGWRSIGGSTIANAGSVHFVSAGSGRTEVRVMLRYDPPAGKVGAKISRILGEDPAANVREDLRRLKAIFDSGNVPPAEAVSIGTA